VVGEGGRRLFTDPLHVFEANIFHPLRHTLAYSESLLSAGVLVAPLNAVTGNPILGYNLYFLATYALSAFGAFLLVHKITGDPRAGLVAGWMFGLTDERWWYGGRLPALSVHWVPFVLLAWIRMLEKPAPARAVVLGLALLANGHASAYYALMVPVLLAPWALTLALVGPWKARAWFRAGGTAVCAIALSLVLYIPYVALHAEIPYQQMTFPTPWRIQRYWAGLGDLFQELKMPLEGSRWSLNGSFLPLLVAAAALAVARARPAALVAPSPTEAAHLAAFTVFWLVAATMSCDPIVPGIPGPFELLQPIPGFADMRNSDRFALLASLGGSGVLGIAVASLLRRARRRLVTVCLLAALAGLIVVDTRTLREAMPLRPLGGPEELPAVYRWLATTDPHTAVWELPASLDDDAWYMVQSLYHGRRLVNGYSAIVPRLFRPRGNFLDELDVGALQGAGVSYVIVHTDRAARTRYGAHLARRAQARSDLSQRWFDSALVVEIPQVTPRLPEARGHELDGRAWRLEGSAPGVERAADGDAGTHWTPDPGARASFLRIALPSRTRITELRLRLGAHVLEFPRSYTVWASDDGVTWRQIGGEVETMPPFVSYRRDHLDIELALRVRPAWTRYLEIRVPAAPAPFHLWASLPVPNWGVHELRVFAAER
jgi:hypothetical protein